MSLYEEGTGMVMPVAPMYGGGYGNGGGFGNGGFGGDGWWILLLFILLGGNGRMKSRSIRHKLNRHRHQADQESSGYKANRQPKHILSHQRQVSC